MRMKKAQKIELLKRVRKMIARPKGWSKGSWSTRNLDREYPAYCLAAACQVAANEIGLMPDMGGDFTIFSTEVADHVSLKKVVQSRGFGYVPGFNDHDDTRRKDVLSVIDERIAQLEAGEK